MAEFGFQGSSKLALDVKGRLAVPVRHRDALLVLSQGQVTITKHPDGCLLIFPRPAWATFRESIRAFSAQAIGWKRVFLGSALDIDIDASSRLLIPPELRLYAGLSKDVVLMGMESHLELWDAARYDTYEAAVIQQGLPPALHQLVY